MKLNKTAKEDLLENVIEAATETIVENARKQDEMLGEISTPDDVLFKRDEMSEAWDTIEKVEKSKSVKEIHTIMKRYMGTKVADRVIKNS